MLQVAAGRRPASWAPRRCPVFHPPGSGQRLPELRRQVDDDACSFLLLHCQYGYGTAQEEHVGADLSGRTRCRPRRMGPRGPVVT